LELCLCFWNTFFAWHPYPSYKLRGEYQPRRLDLSLCPNHFFNIDFLPPVFRGTTFLFTQNRFLTTVLPLIFIPVSAAFSLIALFYLKMSTIIIYTAFLWGFLLVNNNILGVIFLYSFAQGFPLRVMRGKLCALLLSLGWFFILGLDFFLWFVAVLYHPEFWILKISSIGGWYLLRSLAYLIILAGALLCARCRPKAEQ